MTSNPTSSQRRTSASKEESLMAETLLQIRSNSIELSNAKTVIKPSAAVAQSAYTQTSRAFSPNLQHSPEALVRNGMIQQPYHKPYIPRSTVQSFQQDPRHILNQSKKDDASSHTKASNAALLHLLSTNVNNYPHMRERLYTMAYQQSPPSQNGFPFFGLSVENVQQRNGFQAGVSVDAESLSQSQHHISCAEQIRIQEVERALKSKPQRGRKRADLSDVERLELTRTRNREHAKSTRIRKKSRHSELLEKEQRYVEMSQTSTLNRQRRQAFVECLKIRERMLQSHFQQSDSSSADQRGETTQMSSNLDSSLSLSDVVEDMSSLTYENNTFEDDTVSFTAVENMKMFDLSIFNKIVDKFGLKPSSRNEVSVSYQCSLDEVGITCRGFAMAEVKITMNRPVEGLIMSALVQMEFSTQSSKVKAIRLKRLNDALDCFDLDQLNAHVSHPSFVSLDTDHDIQRELLLVSAVPAECKTDIGEDGPGMEY